jgi:hypothetical protein
MFSFVPTAFTALMVAVAPASGSPASAEFGAAGFSPAAPVSAFARPAFWFDPSRLSISTEVSVGSGLAGRGVDALQVTRFSYQFGGPLSMRVSLGNAFGPQAAGSGSSFFLEGLDLAYRPFRSMQIQVHYQDFRSPLQLSRPGDVGVWR